MSWWTCGWYVWICMHEDAGSIPDVGKYLCDFFITIWYLIDLLSYVLFESGPKIITV